MRSSETATDRSTSKPTPLPPPPRQVSEDPVYAAAERPKRIFISVGAATALLYLLMIAYGAQSLRTLRTVQVGWFAPGWRQARRVRCTCSNSNSL